MYQRPDWFAGQVTLYIKETDNPSNEMPLIVTAHISRLARSAIASITPSAVQFDRLHRLPASIPRENPTAFPTDKGKNLSLNQVAKLRVIPHRAKHQIRQHDQPHSLMPCKFCNRDGNRASDDGIKSRRPLLADLHVVYFGTEASNCPAIEIWESLTPECDPF